MQLCGLDYGFRMHLLPLVRWCMQAGFEVCCCGPRGSFHRDVIARGHRYIEVPFTRNMDLMNHLRCLRRLIGVLREERIDILHTHSLIGGVLGRVAARRAGVPLSIYTAHGFRFHPGQNPLARQFYVACERLGSRYTDFLFTQNKEDREAAVRFGLAPAHRIRVIGNGVEVRRFQRDTIPPVALDRVREELSIPEGATVITTIVRPTREKGAVQFIKMANRVAELRADTCFLAVLAPIENERHSIRETLVRQPHTPNLRILGYRTDVPTLLALTDIYVQASQYEGLARALMEAMVSGATPVVSDVRGNREMVTHGETGLLAPYGDIDAFVGALVHLVDDSVRRVRIGQRARGFALKHYDENAMLGEQVRVIRELAVERFGARAERSLSEV
ncbi:MAG: glycosyltransferase family 4 protein [Candidatus Rokubacteria bacterium]|nr:glycosyltransferase family 4 protein [Candidatus Rokubacteria bacterium]